MSKDSSGGWSGILLTLGIMFVSGIIGAGQMGGYQPKEESKPAVVSTNQVDSELDKLEKLSLKSLDSLKNTDDSLYLKHSGYWQTLKYCDSLQIADKALAVAADSADKRVAGKTFYGNGTAERIYKKTFDRVYTSTFKTLSTLPKTHL